MIRNLLATTALATMISTVAYAQQDAAPAPAPAETVQPAAPSAQPVVQRADGHLATNLIGETVYNGTGDQAQNVGDVNDVVIDADGKVSALVVGVGGFLGIGEKNVAVDFAKASWAEKDGDRWLVIDTTKEALQAQAAFDRKPYDVAPATVATTETAPAASDAPAVAETETSAPAATSTPDDTKTAAIDRTTLTEIQPGELRSQELVGTTVYGKDDAKIGEVGDIALSTDGKVDAVILDVGGFLGVGEKEVAVGMDNLAFMTDKDGNKYLYTAFTKEQLDAQAAYDKGSYSEKRDQQRLIINP